MFQINLIHGSDLATTLISGELDEKIFFMAVEDIFDTICVKVRPYLCVLIHLRLILFIWC